MYARADGQDRLRSWGNTAKPHTWQSDLRSILADYKNSNLNKPKNGKMEEAFPRMQSAVNIRKGSSILLVVVLMKLIRDRLIRVSNMQICWLGYGKPRLLMHTWWKCTITQLFLNILPFFKRCSYTSQKFYPRVHALSNEDSLINDSVQVLKSEQIF